MDPRIRHVVKLGLIQLRRVRRKPAKTTKEELALLVGLKLCPYMNGRPEQCVHCTVISFKPIQPEIIYVCIHDYFGY
jgi:hypothetical protein